MNLATPALMLAAASALPVSVAVIGAPPLTITTSALEMSKISTAKVASVVEITGPVVMSESIGGPVRVLSTIAARTEPPWIRRMRAIRNHELAAGRLKLRPAAEIIEEVARSRA